MPAEEPTASSSGVSPEPSGLLPGHRAAGLAIGVGTLISLAVMSHHPVVRADDIQEFVEQVVHLASMTRIVHGAALLGLAILVLGFWGLVDHLGKSLTTVRAGWIAYVVGTLAAGSAGILNGFVAPAVAERYTDAAAATLDALRPALVSTGALENTVAQLSVIGWSLAMAFWSLALWRRTNHRVLAGIGLVAALVTLVTLGLGRLPMSVAGYGMVIAGQAVWNLGVAIALYRGLDRRPS